VGGGREEREREGGREGERERREREGEGGREIRGEREREGSHIIMINILSNVLARPITG